MRSLPPELLGVACAFALAASLGCVTRVEVLASTPRTQEEQLIADAARSLREGRKGEGDRLLRALIEELQVELQDAPRQPEARLWLGTAHHLLENDRAALQQFEAAATSAPDAVTAALASYDVGQIYQLRHENDAALAWFLRAQRADQSDWRTAAKLVQVYQALGRTWDRDRERQRVIDLHNKGSKVDAVEFCRERFQEGPFAVRAFERFELSGTRSKRYRFVVMDAAHPPVVRVLSLGSYEETSGLAQRHKLVEGDQRFFHLDSYGPRGEHQTFAFFTSEPSYEDVKERILQILRGSSRPLSGTIPGVRGPGPRVMPARLQINGMETTYIKQTFVELLNLSRNISMDPDHVISVLQLASVPDVGTILLANLAGSPRTVTIVATTRGNVTVPAVVEDARDNKKGTDALVYFNPEFDPAIPTVTAGGRVVNQRGRPAYIGLAHELIHALHCVNGTLADSEERLPFSYRDGRGNLVVVDEDLEELRTVGLDGHRNGPTENEIRQFHQISPRGAYRPEESERAQ